MSDALHTFEKYISPDKLPKSADQIMSIIKKVKKNCIIDDKYVVSKKNYVKIKETDCDFQEVRLITIRFNAKLDTTLNCRKFV